MVPDRNIVAGFESLDEVDLVSIFNRRANVMRSIPHVLRGPFVGAVRIAIREALEARVGGHEGRLIRGMEALLVASSHVTLPSSKRRHDSQITIDGTLCEVPKRHVE